MKQFLFFPFYWNLFFFQFHFRYVNELTLNVTFHMNINKSRMKKILHYGAVVAFEFFITPKSSIPRTCIPSKARVNTFETSFSLHRRVCICFLKVPFQRVRNEFEFRNPLWLCCIYMIRGENQYRRFEKYSNITLLPKRVKKRECSVGQAYKISIIFHTIFITIE